MSNLLEDISVITYTNSKCHDVLNIHLKQLDKFASQIKSYVLTNEYPKFDVGNHQIILYNDSDPYYVQWTKSLDSVKENYLIYQQEDFFLDNQVNYNEVKRCKNFLESSDYSFVRLLKVMLEGAIHRPELKMKSFDDIKLDDNIYDAHVLDPDSFAFMMQSTLWKKKDFIKLYEHVKSQMWLESREWDKGMREIKTKGSYYYGGSLKTGKYHWEPEIWPYICTAVGKGKWNVSHHGDRLTNMLNEYKIDIGVRGTR
jgi:hypothetical protein